MNLTCVHTRLYLWKRVFSNKKKDLYDPKGLALKKKEVSKCKKEMSLLLSGEGLSFAVWSSQDGFLDEEIFFFSEPCRLLSVKMGDK